MTNEEHIKRVEQSFVMLTKLARKANERLDFSDKRMDAFREDQANTDAKLAALADAQIRAEDRMTRTEGRMEELTTKVSGLTTAMTTLAERMAELAEAQAHTDRRLDALIDIIRQGR